MHGKHSNGSSTPDELAHYAHHAAAESGDSDASSVKGRRGVWRCAQTTRHCRTVLSLPPTETTRRWSGEKRTPITCDECPARTNRAPRHRGHRHSTASESECGK